MYRVIKKLGQPWHIMRTMAPTVVAPPAEDWVLVDNVRLLVFRMWTELNSLGSPDSLTVRSHLELIYNQAAGDNNVTALINENDPVSLDIQAQQFRIVGPDRAHFSILFHDPNSHRPFIMQDIQKLEINADTANPHLFQFGYVTVGVSQNEQDPQKPTTAGRWDYPYPPTKDQLPKSRYELLRKVNDGQGTGDIDLPAQGV